MKQFVRFVLVFALCASTASCSLSSGYSGLRGTKLLVVEIGMEESYLYPLCNFISGKSTPIDPDGFPDPTGALLYIKPERDVPAEANFLVVRKVAWGDKYDEPNLRYYVVESKDVLASYQNSTELKEQWHDICGAKK